ncbi:MAG: DUF3098 domain-containing protein [Flavobacteriaceae bacterium]|nr:DUF3098 domain-containing protein [Flavobacteriaceae bacterium]
MRIEPDKAFLFGKRNYIIMGIGLALIAIGFFLMTGHDANTRPDGTFDPNYWNEDIFSWRRIRLAPFLVIAGFLVQVYAILTQPNSKKISE